MKNHVPLLILVSFSIALKGQSVCSEAATATLGTNSIPATTNNAYWYTYTMPSDGKLQITSSNYNYVYVYDGSCENPSSLTSSYEDATAPLLNSGDQVLIRWETMSGGDFTWSLSVSASEPGDACGLTATATTGTNTLPTTTNSTYWYSYTMPSDGKLQISSSSSKLVSVYSNTCENLNHQRSGYGNTSVATLHSGDQVFIKWREASSLDWDLAVVLFDPAENCTSAITATVGVNSLPATSYNYYWYAYTMPTDGRLTVSSSSSANVSIYGNSCNDLVYLNGAFRGSNATAQVSSGDQVFIRWSTFNGGNFDWTLSIEALDPGEGCPSAVTASMGTNITSEAPYWFEYTIPVSGDYTISSVGNTTEDTYLSVYSDCSGTLLGENDDVNFQNGMYQSELSLSLTAGETIYIYWDDYYTSAGFDWTLSSDAQAITFETLSSKTVEDAGFDLTAIASSGLPVSYLSSNESVATISGNTVTIVGAGATTITASQAGDNTYRAAESVSQVLTVHKAPQTITVDAIADQLIDASPLTVNAAASSSLALGYAVTGPATIDGNVITLTGTEGTVRVTVSQAGNHYYQETSSSISFRVTDPSLQVQTITFEPLPAKMVDDADFTLTASASSGLPITYRSSDERVATVSGNTVMIVGAGTITITAHQAGNTTYRAASASQELTVTNPRQTTADCGNLAVTITEKNNNTCSGSTDGSLTAVATGGQAPYGYSIDGINFQDSNRFEALDSGTYVITINDASACTATVEAVITTPDILAIAGQVDHSTESAGNGRITLNISGGKAPYAYVWSNEATTATINNLVLGEYSVTVTDDQGCTATNRFTVEGVTSIEDRKQQEIAVYPNPIRHVLRIEVPQASKIKGATLFDLTGKKVLEMSLVGGKNQIDARALKAGSYLLMLGDGSSQRIVVR